MRKSISAEIIADSKNREGNRITTFVVTFPRIVLAELNTHRVFSRNSASSRAIPFKKMVKMVEEDPFIPIKWQKDHSGMQGTEYFSDQEVDDFGIDVAWLNSRNSAVLGAKQLNGIGATKQLCNRLLEPFMWHTAIITSTDYENFFALRAHPQAEIHIAKLAEVMLEAYNESSPKQLKPGEWHIPFGDKFHPDRIYDLYQKSGKKSTTDQFFIETEIKIATARCARVSYLNFEGKDDYEADIKLHDRLSEMGHFSPFEHCAMAPLIQEPLEITQSQCSDEQISEFTKEWLRNRAPTPLVICDDVTKEVDFKFSLKNLNQFGNFKGFIQYRKMFDQENKGDSRVINK